MACSPEATPFGAERWYRARKKHAKGEYPDCLVRQHDTNDPALFVATCVCSKPLPACLRHGHVYSTRAFLVKASITTLCDRSARGAEEQRGTQRAHQSSAKHCVCNQPARQCAIFVAEPQVPILFRMCAPRQSHSYQASAMTAAGVQSTGGRPGGVDLTRDSPRQ